MNSLEDVEKKLFLKHGDKVKLISRSKSTEKSEFVCNCGHTWVAVLSSVIKGNACPECRKQNMYQGMREKFAFAHEQIEQKIKDLGCELISGEYINAHSTLEVKCTCGAIYKTNWNTFNSGGRCSNCGREKANKSMRLTEEEAIQKVNSTGLVFVGFDGEYFDSRTKALAKCELGHITKQAINDFNSRPYCQVCNKQEKIKLISGSNSAYWQGGVTAISEYLKKQITPWKKDSMENCNHKCIITGKRFGAIHHLYSYNLILKDAFKEIDIPIKLFVSDYSGEELELLSKKVLEIHYRYPLGICLTKEIHSKFHSIYGSGNNTPEQWEEFKKSL